MEIRQGLFFCHNFILIYAMTFFMFNNFFIISILSFKENEKYPMILYKHIYIIANNLSNDTYNVHYN